MGSKTFILLKPDALERGLVDQVMLRFLEAGYRIERLHYRIIGTELIRCHYDEVIRREGPGFVDWLDEEFVGKPCLAMVLTYPEEDGVQLARVMLGNRRPELAEKGTIRGDFGIPVLDPEVPAMNLIHASDSEISFEKEKGLWFGDSPI